MKVYEITIRINDNFTNYLGNKVYSSKEKADKEIDRLIESRSNKTKTKVIDNQTSDGGRNVQIVNKSDELDILEWFGYQALEVI